MLHSWTLSGELYLDPVATAPSSCFPPRTTASLNTLLRSAKGQEKPSIMTGETKKRSQMPTVEDKIRIYRWRKSQKLKGKHGKHNALQISQCGTETSTKSIMLHEHFYYYYKKGKNRGMSMLLVKDQKLKL